MIIVAAVLLILTGLCAHLTRIGDEPLAVVLGLIGLAYALYGWRVMSKARAKAAAADEARMRSWR